MASTPQPTNFEKVAQKGKALELTAADIKKAIKLFEYAKSLGIEFYSKDSELRMRKITKPFTKEDKNKLDSMFGGGDKSFADLMNQFDSFGKK